MGIKNLKRTSFRDEYKQSKNVFSEILLPTYISGRM